MRPPSVVGVGLEVGGSGSVCRHAEIAHWRVTRADAAARAGVSPRERAGVLARRGLRPSAITPFGEPRLASGLSVGGSLRRRRGGHAPSEARAFPNAGQSPFAPDRGRRAIGNADR
jgi:hypothetical protein